MKLSLPTVDRRQFALGSLAAGVDKAHARSISLEPTLVKNLEFDSREEQADGDHEDDALRRADER